jgi:hypothetical protein
MWRRGADRRLLTFELTNVRVARREKLPNQVRSSQVVCSVTVRYTDSPCHVTIKRNTFQELERHARRSASRSPDRGPAHRLVHRHTAWRLDVWRSGRGLSRHTDVHPHRVRSRRVSRRDWSTAAGVLEHTGRDPSTIRRPYRPWVRHESTIAAIRGNPVASRDPSSSTLIIEWWSKALRRMNLGEHLSLHTHPRTNV